MGGEQKDLRGLVRALDKADAEIVTLKAERDRGTRIIETLLGDIPGPGGCSGTFVAGWGAAMAKVRVIITTLAGEGEP